MASRRVILNVNVCARLGCLLSCALLLSCAQSPTLPEGQLQILTTSRSQALAGISCTVTTGGGSWSLVTPATIQVGPAQGDLRIVCEHPAYRSSEVQIRAGQAGGGVQPRIGLGVGGGFGGHSSMGLSLGLGFPLQLGRARYPSQVVVDMTPLSPP